MKNRLPVFLTIIAIAAVATSAFAQEAPPIPKRISKGVVNGQAISLPKPAYPAAAAAVNAKGSVSVAVVISRNGEVISARAISGHPLLRRAASVAARNARFRPTRLNGVPVEVSGVLVYNFLGGKVDDKLQNPPKEADSSPLGIAMLTNVMISVTADSRFEEFSKKMFEEIINDIRAGSNEDMPEAFNEFPQATKQRRLEILNEFYSDFMRDKTGDELWQMEVGEILARLFVESLLDTGSKEERTISYKTALTELEGLLYSAPIDFRKDLMKELRKLTEYGGSADFGSGNERKIILDLVTEIMDSAID